MKMKKQTKEKALGKSKKGKERAEEMSRVAEKRDSTENRAMSGSITDTPRKAAQEGRAAANPGGQIMPRAEAVPAGRTQPGERSVVPVKPLSEKAPGGRFAAASRPAAANREAEPPCIKKEYVESRGRCKVTFRLPAAAAPTAKRVTIVGDFNGWNREADRLRRQENGDFAVTLDLDAGREYRFRYLIDGQLWENDWRADKYVKGPYGADDSVVCV